MATITSLSTALMNDVKATTLSTDGVNRLITSVNALMKTTNPPIDPIIARLNTGAVLATYSAEINKSTLSIDKIKMLLNQLVYVAPVDPAAYHYRAQEFLITTQFDAIYRIVYLSLAALLRNANFLSKIDPILTINDYYAELVVLLRRVDNNLQAELVRTLMQPPEPALNENVEMKSEVSTSPIAEADLKKKKKKKKKKTKKPGNSETDATTPAEKTPSTDATITVETKTSNDTAEEDVTIKVMDANIHNRENLIRPIAVKLDKPAESLSESRSTEKITPPTMPTPVVTSMPLKKTAERKQQQEGTVSLQPVTLYAPTRPKHFIVRYQPHVIPTPTYITPMHYYNQPTPIDIAQYGISMMKYNLKLEFNVIEPVTEDYNLQLEKWARARLINANSIMANACQHATDGIQHQLALQQRILAQQYVDITQLNAMYYTIVGPTWPAIIPYTRHMPFQCDNALASIRYNDLYTYHPLPIALLHTPAAEYYHGALLADVARLDVQLNTLCVNNDYQHRKLAAYQLCQQEYATLIASQAALINFHQRQLTSYRALTQQNLFTPTFQQTTVAPTSHNLISEMHRLK